jgi:hypothetical protein
METTEKSEALAGSKIAIRVCFCNQKKIENIQAQLTNRIREETTILQQKQRNKS